MEILKEPRTGNQEPSKKYRFLAWFLILGSCFYLLGCVRLTGNAGYSKVKDNEAVTKSTGFDLDSSRLVDNRGIS